MSPESLLFLPSSSIEILPGIEVLFLFYIFLYFSMNRWPGKRIASWTLFIQPQQWLRFSSPLLLTEMKFHFQEICGVCDFVLFQPIAINAGFYFIPFYFNHFVWSRILLSPPLDSRLRIICQNFKVFCFRFFFNIKRVLCRLMRRLHDARVLDRYKAFGCHVGRPR